MPIIRPCYAFHTEVVEIHWRLEDGRLFHMRYTCPPKDVIEARLSRSVSHEEEVPPVHVNVLAKGPTEPD
jgi:hypothetical protein